ncbi:MAG: hypothetical protein WEF86_05175 [Gemmatimonadota bacterium]
MARRKLFLPLLLFIFACEGPAGPMGPPGAEGEAGPGSRIVFSGLVPANGLVEVPLPPAAGTLADPPLLSGYIAPTVNDPFYLVSDSYTEETTPWMALHTQNGILHAVMVQAPVGWLYRIVVVY